MVLDFLMPAIRVSYASCVFTVACDYGTQMYLLVKMWTEKILYFAASVGVPWLNARLIP